MALIRSFLLVKSVCEKVAYRLRYRSFGDGDGGGVDFRGDGVFFCESMCRGLIYHKIRFFEYLWVMSVPFFYFYK